MYYGQQKKAFLFGLALFILLPFQCANAQTIVDDTLSLESNIKSLYGVEKLAALNDLSVFYRNKNDRKHMRFSRQAKDIGQLLYKSNNDSVLNNEVGRAFENWARINFEKEKYYEFGEYVDQLIEVQELLNDSILRNTLVLFNNQLDSLENLGAIKSGFFNRTFSNLKIGSIRKETENLKIKTQLSQARTKEKNQKFLQAISHYQEAINLYKNQGADAEITNLHLKIASLYDSLGLYENSEKYLEKVVDSLSTYQPEASTIEKMTELDNLSRDSLLKRQEEYQTLSKNFENASDFRKSLEYFELYQQVSQKLFTDSVKSATQTKLRENEITLLTQQKNIATLNLEKSKAENEKQVQLKRTYLIIGLLALISTIIGYSLFLSKRKKHKKLTAAYEDLDLANTKLKDAENRITTLLQQQVSTAVADELLKSKEDGSGKAKQVSVLFLDIRGFTKMAQKLTAKELISFQNMAFGPMLDSIQNHDGIVNQLMGDGFMATFGISDLTSNHCQQAFLAALEILKNLKERVAKKEVRPYEIGIGIHTGSVVVGNVGNEKRKQFSITGNPVIIASRLEQLNKTYKSNLIFSKAIFNGIDVDKRPISFKTEEVSVKGRDDSISICILNQ